MQHLALLLEQTQ